LSLLLAAARPATAFIKAPPPPELGALCQLASHISVLRVEKLSTEKGVILFKSVEQLKAREALPEGMLAKLVVGSQVEGGKAILDWAAEGKWAVLFAVPRSQAGHLYIDGFWCRVRLDEKRGCWDAVAGEPHMLTGYCGSADKLGEAVTKMLRGESVVVPGRLGEQSGRPVVRDLRSSLPAPDKSPDRIPRKPDLRGTVQALAGDGKSFSLLPDKGSAAIDLRVTDVTRITTGKELCQLGVGQTVYVWLGEGDGKTAATVEVNKPKQ
jgi:hypothetical protein